MPSVAVLVWGATGVTGSRVCRELAKRYQGRVSWGMAGRNLSKMELLREELTAINEQCKEIPLVVASIQDKESVEAMVRQAEIVIACAGPFPKYSDVVVEACVKESTHFVDVTGETAWVKSVIDRFHEEAQRKKIKVVNFGGFDSVPADIGCFLLSNYVRNRYGRGVSRILGLYSMKSDGGNPFSGGTIDSAINAMNSGKEVKRIIADPHCLTPPNKRPPDGGRRDSFGVEYDKDFKVWKSPFVMQAVNTRVVRRSNALFDTPYGSSFDYSEAVGSSSWFGAFMNTVPLAILGFFLSVPFLRALGFWLGLLPKPGDGPSIEADERVRWKVTFQALVEPEAQGDGSKPLIAKGSVSDNYGGYTSTARLVVECALCQVLEKDRLKQLGMADGGVMTPAFAFGQVLVDRLNAIGIKVQIEETTSSKL